MVGMGRRTTGNDIFGLRKAKKALGYCAQSQNTHYLAFSSWLVPPPNQVNECRRIDLNRFIRPWNGPPEGELMIAGGKHLGKVVFQTVPLFRSSLL